MHKRATQEDANLFLGFLRQAKILTKRHSSETIPKKKVVKIRFKSLNSEVGELMFYNPNIPMVEKNTEYSCTYCGAKYVYKRCLINHMIKNHRNKLL